MKRTTNKTVPENKPMQKLNILQSNALTKVEAIVQSIAMDIEKGLLPKGHHLPSINEFNRQYGVARDTAEKAYKELRRQGYIESFPSRGYFVAGKKDHKLKVLLVFNKLSSYKKLIYDGLVEALGDKATVDLQIHHYDLKTLEQILDKHLGQYHHYVVMPHFAEGTSKKEIAAVIKKIPPQQLLILDKALPFAAKSSAAVYQDFRNDICGALSSAAALLKKYKGVRLIFPPYSNHPKEIIDGLSAFAAEQKKTFSTIASADGETLAAGTLYIVIAEADLAQLVKKTRNSKYKLGKEVGILSFNETILKDLLDIAVVTTDFEGMGRAAAGLILSNQTAQIKNPFRFIKRSSV